MKKYSKQREMIVENLRKRKDHPTVEKLFVDLKREIPELGIATVYRNLAELCEKKEVTRIKVKVGPDRYDGNQETHIHFECKQCGELIDVAINGEQKERIREIAQELIKKENIEVEDTSLNLEGICQKCKEKCENC